MFVVFNLKRWILKQSQEYLICYTLIWVTYKALKYLSTQNMWSNSQGRSNVKGRVGHVSTSFWVSKDNFSRILPKNQVEISYIKYCLQYQVSIEEILREGKELYKVTAKIRNET